MLILFLGKDGGFAGWLRLADGAVAARGSGLKHPAAGERLVAIVPSEQVTLRRAALEGAATPAQAAAAARLMLAEASAQPIAEMHVAAAREAAEDGLRWAALVPLEDMSRWMAALAAEGVEPAHVVPDVLLIAPPAEGFARYDRDDGMALYRSDGAAFALEPELAALVVGERPVAVLDAEQFEAGLAASLSPPVLDLRQGPFARRRQWRAEPARLRRLALWGAALLVATLAVQAAAIVRYTFAADALEAETRQIAASALPRAAGLTDPESDLGRRLAELRGGGAGYGATAAALFAAVRATPNVELSALSFGGDGSLRVSVAGDGPASVQALAARIGESGFAVDSSPPRSGGGRQIVDLTVRPR